MHGRVVAMSLRVLCIRQNACGGCLSALKARVRIVLKNFKKLIRVLCRAHTPSPSTVNEVDGEGV